MEQLTIDDNLESQRLDQAMTLHEKIVSRTYAQRLIQGGRVLVNRSKDNVNPKKKVKPGDLIQFELIPPEDTQIEAVPFELDIPYEDETLLVVNKPRGMVVHPSFGHHNDTLVNYLMHHCKLSDVSAARPGIVHRLDKDTSGLLVVAKDNHTHLHLARQFFEHSIERKYLALVRGEPKRPAGTFDGALGRHPVHRKKWAVKEGGKRAVTHYKVIDRFGFLSLVECRLETGRTHQIRVHFSTAGHPILGDPVYGTTRRVGSKLAQTLKEAIQSLEGQALHAKHLGFIHPTTQKKVTFDAEIPEDMKKIVSLLNHPDK